MKHILFDKPYKINKYNIIGFDDSNNILLHSDQIIKLLNLDIFIKNYLKDRQVINKMIIYFYVSYYLRNFKIYTDYENYDHDTLFKFSELPFSTYM